MRWREIEKSRYGCRQWQTGDGMFLLVCIDRFEDIPMRRIYVLWQWRRGSWWKVEERRSRKAIEKLAKQRAEQLETDDD